MLTWLIRTLAGRAHFRSTVNAGDCRAAEGMFAVMMLS
jgi:hypothetical protein